MDLKSAFAGVGLVGIGAAVGVGIVLLGQRQIAKNVQSQNIGQVDQHQALPQGPIVYIYNAHQAVNVQHPQPQHPQPQQPQEDANPSGVAAAA